jgi:hypothetical protein
MWGGIPSVNDSTPKTQTMNRISEEFSGIVSSILSLKLKTEVWFTSVFGGMTVGMITGFVGNWIYSPYESYFSLIGLIICDHLSGMYLAYKTNRFETRKAVRIFWTLCSHTGLLLFASNIAKGEETLFWLDETVFVPLCLVNLLSLVKNLALLGYIKHEFAGWFYKKIDVYKNEFIQKNNDRPGNGDGVVS